MEGQISASFLFIVILVFGIIIFFIFVSLFAPDLFGRVKDAIIGTIEGIGKLIRIPGIG